MAFQFRFRAWEVCTLAGTHLSKITGTFAFAVVFLCTTSASATPGFPGAIATRYNASESQPCSLCHNGPTARGTVTTAFGSAMRERGLLANDTASLESALTKMEVDKVDSDGDGVIDTEQLRAGRNPNPGAVEGARNIDPVNPEYGCVGKVSTGPVHSPWCWLAVGLLVTLMRKRRTPKSQL
jgi:hypothetical protein